MKDRPLFWPKDSFELRRDLEAMRAQGIPVQRPTQYQVKCGAVNFYLPTEVITIDKVGRIDEEGWAAFQELAEKERRRRFQNLFSEQTADREASEDDITQL